MLTAVTCPQCEQRFEIPEDAADEPHRCPRCAYGIQTKAPASSPRKHTDEPDADQPRRRPMPRSPFPFTSLLIIAFGILFMLLAISVGFNVWIITTEDHRFHFEQEMMRAQQEAQRAEQLAMENRMRAEQAANQVAVKEWGVLTGQVRIEGDAPPKRSHKDIIQKHKEGQTLVAGADADDHWDPTWIVNPENKGVANVVISLRAANDKPLAIPPQVRKARPNVVLDMPFANYRPHIVVLTPKVGDFDTGQKLTVRNNGKVPHCVKILADHRNESFNFVLPIGQERECGFRAATNVPIKVSCDMYSWMSAKIWIFDHPYHALTDKDGKFEIPFTPRDVDLRLMIWHEALGFADGKVGRPYHLKAERDDLDLSIRAK